MKAAPHYTIKSPSELMAFLTEVMPGKSRTSIKSLLSHSVYVNGKAVSKYNYLLKVGDKVSIGNADKPDEVIASDLTILFEDASIIVIDKPSGLLSIATKDEKLDTAYRRVSDYVKNQNSKNRVFVLHRLDLETSGVMMFAKSAEIQSKMQRDWDNVVTDRQYLAVVEGKIDPSAGVLIHNLVEGPTGIVHVSHNPEVGQKAITHYATEKMNDDYSLLSLNLETGRKNQIRVQLKEVGFIIVGDKKYGSKFNPINRLALHAQKLSFIHPISGKELSFSSSIPKKMGFLVKIRS